MKTLVVVVARHGTTSLNSQGHFRGSINVPLAPKGIDEAHELAEFLRSYDFAHLVSSDKQRSMQTAHIVSSTKSTPVIPTPSIHPWDVGMFSGKPKNAENKELLEYYIRNPEIPIPQGEALNHFKRRVRPCLAEAVDAANANGKPILLIGHSSIIHETGALFNGDHHSSLVWPGGAVAVYCVDGKLKAEPIFKGKTISRTGSRADTVS